MLPLIGLLASAAYDSIGNCTVKHWLVRGAGDVPRVTGGLPHRGKAALPGPFGALQAWSGVQNRRNGPVWQKPLPVVYKDVRLDCGYRLDLLVEESVIVEIKAIERLAPIHEAQVMSYLRLTSCKVGLLLNFNVKLLKNGIRRLVNNFPASAVKP